MNFNSYVFILFFAGVLITSRLIKNWTLTKGFLLVASYLFYMAWNPAFVLLIWFSTAVDWFAAKGIKRADSLNQKKVFLSLSLLSNLGLLGFFKYSHFLTENLNSIFPIFGSPFQLPYLDILLPVGISFYTFQTLSYSIDVYRGKLAPSKSFLDYALFVTFFPQLVAGPIVRASEFLPQLAAKRRATSEELSLGFSYLIIGLFTKVVIADTIMAPVSDKVFAQGISLRAHEIWIGVNAFSFQILCDFFGYSIIAMGVARCIGFKLPHNFRAPYASIGFSDFWRRWHISLSQWLRDYLYIPLGGSHNGRIRFAASALTTMLLGGLWHGASWSFVIWGGLHGLYLLIERILKGFSFSKNSFWKSFLGKASLSLLTYIAVCVAWIFFRAIDLEHAVSLFTNSFSTLYSDTSFAPILSSWELFYTTIIGLIIFCIQLILRNKSIKEILECTPWFACSTGLAIMVYLTIICMTGSGHDFMYFQF